MLRTNNIIRKKVKFETTDLTEFEEESDAIAHQKELFRRESEKDRQWYYDYYIKTEKNELTSAKMSFDGLFGTLLYTKEERERILRMISRVDWYDSLKGKR